jgi:two-component system LytT family sensor kinase
MNSRTLRRTGKAYLISISLWSGLSLLTGWQYFLFDKSLNIHSTVTDMLRLAEARGFAFALLTPPIFYVVRRYIGAARNIVRYLLAYAVGVVPFMLLSACIRWVILPPWSAALQKYVPRLGHSPLAVIRQGFADQITIYIAILVAAHAYEYYERSRRQEMESCEYQQALAASELQALKMQLHPHFLFNTLHGIATLVDTDQQSAKAMIVKLSSLLRTAMVHNGSDLVPLRDELKFVGEYLELEKMRFGARLTVVWSIEPGTEHMLVPQMILQPLVENAIRHGIAGSRERGWIEIVSRQRATRIELQVRNSTGYRKPAGTGVGLRNTEARLQHLYSDEARLNRRSYGNRQQSFARARQSGKRKASPDGYVG